MTGQSTKPAEIKIPEAARMNLQIYLMDCIGRGWSKQDRLEYMAACQAEFANPTSAGGMSAAIEFWAAKAEAIRSKTPLQTASQP